MEGKTKQKLELFQIPIEEYEKDMKSESAKEKNKEILDLFANSNNLYSEEDFGEIKYELHYAISDGNLDLIKIFLCETIQNDSKDLKFKIDRTNQTASLFYVDNENSELFIPRTVKYESTDYLITSISGINDYVKTIKFAEDSAVKTIHRLFINFSNIKEIYFPPSLKELKEGWCCNLNWIL